MKIQNCSFWKNVRYLLIDSRNLSVPQSTVFFAIKGVKHDGHSFIPWLYEQGVRKFVVSHLPNVSLPEAQFLECENPVHVLQEIAQQHREQFHFPVIGITGSNGKTIVKEWLYQLLSDRYAIVKSPKSYNSQIGVPLSVWEMDSSHTLAIFEAGISQKGEMQRLASIIQPTIGIFTNIGSAHDEGFVNRYEKAKEKALLFSNVQTLIYCVDYPEIVQALQEISIPNVLTWTVQRHQEATFLVEKEILIKSCRLSFLASSLRFPSFSVVLPFVDDASIENAIHCILLMLFLKIEPSEISQKVALLRNIPMRLEVKKGIHRCTLIDDTYNNDFVGLQIALQFQSQQTENLNKTLILSDFAQTDASIYSKIAQLITHYQIQCFVGIGKHLCENRVLFQTNIPRLYFYESTDEFLANQPFFQDESILIKGARHFRFEKIVQALQEKIHGTKLEINLDALTHNLGIYKSLLKPSVKIMAMVKAFAYGAGAVEVAKLLEYHRVDYLAVAYADEGVRLRKAGIRIPIMVMNPMPETLPFLWEYHLEPVVYGFSILEEIINNALRIQKPLKVHIELDTGMRRLGFEVEEIQKVIVHIQNHALLIPTSVFTHLVGADEDKHQEFSLKQIHTFEQIARYAEEKFQKPILKHVLNSSGITRFPDYQFDMVRLGIGLYGIDANQKISRLLKPISTFKTTISQIKTLPAGETIGYGRKGVTLQQPTRIATIAVGYGDGYSRHFSCGVGKVCVKNVLCPVVGNVCMDMTMIDVSNTDAQEGDEVIIFGENPSIESLAQQIGTIPYEILTNIGERVKRVFFSA
ncbi:MAG: bifunctional UDP-N-acetylmuramoyl-tripeptide:D-alanyl-D-alanine ligase/alanine racemase [Cytophagales bacterium]|nr:bifunctional UDP-N-acetylmuramoyl-tripeptide:D-alanyl-D-alanine ligase/alanine racemase [Cytophagales bacterium]MDW8384423.1 bifunctional UDP-N-acetylmuramoyl-tripeptide:D-alanyl-D-alanine ligase/alanine racemase [Flammeovirgaceae bacterium]